MKNKLVIFDCFGVIFDEIAPPFFRRHFDEETAAVLKEKFFVPADLGEITRDELFDNMSSILFFSVRTLSFITPICDIFLCYLCV